MCCLDRREKGFTLIELMVTLVIAMVILAGMVAVFISQTRAAHTVGSKTELMGDLYLASQIIQSELRGAKAVCWDSTNQRLVYQPIDSGVSIFNAATNACDSTDGANAWFKSVAAGAGGCSTSNTPCVCWRRPSPPVAPPATTPQKNCQELLRGLSSASGFLITPTGNADLQTVRTISLTAIYQDINHANQDLNLKFKVWPRNQ